MYFPEDIVAPPYRAGIHSRRVTSTSSNAAYNNRTPRRIGWESMTDSGGFLLSIYALNWLGMQGFELAPEELLQSSDAHTFV
jgi:hypothetical protein